MFARLCAALTCASLQLAEPPERAADAFEPVSITAVERPVDPVVLPEPEPEPELEIVEAPAIGEPEPIPCMADRRCRAMRLSGIAVGVLGLAAVGTGIGLVARPDQVLVDSPAFVTSTHPPGLVVLTLGIGVTLTAVLVLVASRQTRRGPAKAAGLRF